MAKKRNKKSPINYRPYPSLNPSYPPAFLRCKNSKCSEVFPNLEQKNDHERSCLDNTPHHLTPCIICWAPRNEHYVLLPCGHVSLCKSCTIKISGQGANSNCPSCRSPILDYKKLFFQVPE